MSFPRYPAYKDSGVAWLGEVPEHWELKKLKHCILRLGSGGTPESSNPEFWADYDSKDSIPWVAIGDMSAVSRVTSTAKSLTPFGLSSKNLEIFPSGSLLYSIYASLGKVAILGIDAAFNQAILAILPNTQCASQPFLRYWLENLEKHLEYYASSNTQANLNAAKVLNYPVSVPSLPEQSDIASFLDRETAKIDALIAEQQRLIELLQEKRQAVISHAVTKGLNPDAPMKDSGVEWLGEVPEHWEVKRLKDIAVVIDCRNKTPEYHEDGDYLVVRTSNLKRQSLVLDEALYTDKRNFEIWTQRGIPQPGSILFTREAPTGEVCLVPEGIPLCMGQRMMNFVCHDDRFTSFLMIYLQSDCLTRYIESTSHGSTVSHLRVPQVESIPVIVPAHEEVLEIASQVNQLTAVFNNLMDEASRSISLIQERRSALISAAVTGQIDVRGLVPEASAA
jgi:type I restriction enzyme, S subunit